MDNKSLQSLKETFLLMSQYSQIESKLKESGVVRSRKVVADYGEWLSTILFPIIMEDNLSEEGYDCIDPKTKERYQIKTVRKTPGNNVATWCRGKFIKGKSFDWWIVIRFSESFKIRELYKVPFCAIKNGEFTLVKSGSYNLTWKKMKDGGYMLNPTKASNLSCNKKVIDFIFEKK